MSRSSARPSPSPAIVGICAWAVPGLGYWIIGQRARGLTVAITLFVLFMLGILIGGLRVVDPPGYGEYGYRVQLVERDNKPGNQRTLPVEIRRVDPSSPEQEEDPTESGSDHIDHTIGWALTNQFFGEIGNKPWFVGQMFCGPAAFVMSGISIHEAHLVKDPTTGEMQERVPASHSRSWEIGTLYTAVAGMLNLLAIIDSVYRAGQENE